MEGNASFGYWLRRRRKTLDLTQEELARRVGCSAALIRMVEADARRPSRQIAERLAEVLEIPQVERTAFVKAARAQLAVDRLTLPTSPTHWVSTNLPTGVVTALDQAALVAASVLPELMVVLPSGVVTFLATDIEGSSQLWEQHPATMPAALARHDALVRQAVEAQDGVVFKGTGDGVMAAFAQAPDALAAALAAQQALQTEVWLTHAPLQVRMALHTGVAEEREGDYFGPPLNRVARLVAAGHGGQILLSRVTEELVHDQLPPGAKLRDLGTHRLKGLTRPEQIFQLVAPDLHTDFPPLTTLASSMAPALAPPLPLHHPSVQPDRNRRRMLTKVSDFWIKGVLEHSLHGAALLDLGLHYQPDAVAQPWAQLVQQPEQHRRMFPSTPITAVFDALGGDLLILGAPGAGKTTLLLELARTLLDRAEQDITHPMPIVFNLASWAAQRRPLSEWLSDELNVRYDVPKKIGHAWVETDQILPLLDGLDEVRQEQRAACVEAINAFRREHGLVGMVVCSRSADYAVLTTRLKLQGAVQIQPLTAEQIDQYLALEGEALIGLRVALSADPVLQELAQSPLLLNIMMLVYAGGSGTMRSTDGGVLLRRQQLFATYVERMAAWRGSVGRYTPAQTIRWLGWFAQAMIRRGQSSFFIEQLQADWLPSRMARWQYLVVDRLGIGATIGMVVGLLAGLGAGLVNDLSFRSSFGLIAVVTAVTASLFGGACRTLVVSRSAHGRLIVSTISLALGLMLFSGWGFGQIQGQIGLPWGILVGGLVSGLAVGLLGLPDVRPRCIAVVDTLRWSLENAAHAARLGLLGGFVSGLVLGVIDDLVMYRVVTPQTISWGMNLGMLFGVVFGCISGVAGGLTGSEVETTVRPNQGIWRSARSGVLAGLVSGLLGLAGAVIIGLLYERPINELLFMGLTFMLLSATIGALAYGGQACLSHLALRFVLWHHGVLPWHIPRFLDDSTERMFLSKVGGGYIFVHRLLLEYFAAQANESGTTPLHEPKSTE
jgi:eukaryotic-like serine/threonine-protein kinase